MKLSMALLAGTLSMSFLGGCATLSAEPISAQVVDADTGQPLEGVVIVARWELHAGSFTGDALPCGAADVEEAVTDKDGHFHIPGWGPITSSCDMRSSEPALILFKPGYYPNVVNNPTYSIETVSVSHSVWDGKTFRLRRYAGADLRDVGPSSYANAYRDLNQFDLSFIVDYPGACNWRKLPNVLRAILAQDKAFNEAGRYPDSIVLKLTDANDYLEKFAPQCGSPKVFIEGLKK